jgi:hypothetical protein
MGKKTPEVYFILFHLSYGCIAYCSVTIQSLTTEALYAQLPLLGTYIHPADVTEHGPDSARQPALLLIVWIGCQLNPPVVSK